MGKKESVMVSPAEVVRMRAAAGLTQRDAATLVGVHETTWQRWELGTVKRIRRATLAPVALAAKRQR